MANGDTVKLLKECDAGTKTAVNSFKEVLDNVKSEQLLSLLNASLQEHERLGNRIHEELSKCGDGGKEPSAMAKAMSWMKINMKMMDNGGDKTIAGLMTDGCDMGIKQLSEYLNKYPSAESTAVALAKDIIAEEDKLAHKLREFL